jgi:hypothetical protein
MRNGAMRFIRDNHDVGYAATRFKEDLEEGLNLLRGCDLVDDKPLFDRFDKSVLEACSKSLVKINKVHETLSGYNLPEKMETDVRANLRAISDSISQLSVMEHSATSDTSFADYKESKPFQTLKQSISNTLAFQLEVKGMLRDKQLSVSERPLQGNMDMNREGYDFIDNAQRLVHQADRFKSLFSEYATSIESVPLGERRAAFDDMHYQLSQQTLRYLESAKDMVLSLNKNEGGDSYSLLAKDTVLKITRDIEALLIKDHPEYKDYQQDASFVALGDDVSDLVQLSDDVKATLRIPVKLDTLSDNGLRM